MNAISTAFSSSTLDTPHDISQGSGQETSGTTLEFTIQLQHLLGKEAREDRQLHGENKPSYCRGKSKRNRTGVHGEHL